MSSQITKKVHKEENLYCHHFVYGESKAEWWDDFAADPAGQYLAQQKTLYPCFQARSSYRGPR